MWPPVRFSFSSNLEESVIAAKSAGGAGADAEHHERHQQPFRMRIPLGTWAEDGADEVRSGQRAHSAQP